MKTHLHHLLLLLLRCFAVSVLRLCLARHEPTQQATLLLGCLSVAIGRGDWCCCCCCLGLGAFGPGWEGRPAKHAANCTVGTKSSNKQPGSQLQQIQYR